MPISFACSYCGKTLAVDDSLAGKHGHCKHCGKEMTVPSPAFRLAPLEDDADPGEAAGKRPAASGTHPAGASGSEKKLRLAPVEKPASKKQDPEAIADDGQAYEIDKDYDPPITEAATPVPVLMEARAGWRHTVRVLMKKLATFEDAIYLVLMLSWFVGAAAFLFELKPLAWSMLGLLVVCSILLLVLGGFDLFIRPFKESLRHGLAFVFVPPYAIYYIITRWDQMKRPFKKALGAFAPLLILLVLVFFSRPIRDWFLHAPPKKKDGELAAIAPSPPVPGIPVLALAGSDVARRAADVAF